MPGLLDRLFDYRVPGPLDVAGKLGFNVPSNKQIQGLLGFGAEALPGSGVVESQKMGQDMTQAFDRGNYLNAAGLGLGAMGMAGSELLGPAIGATVRRGIRGAKTSFLNPTKNLSVKERNEIIQGRELDRWRWERKLERGLLGGPKLKTEDDYLKFRESRSKKRQRWPEEEKEAYREYKNINELRQKNKLDQSNADPLVDAQKSRPWKARDLKDAKKVLVTDSDNLWSKTFKNEIVKESGYKDLGNVNRVIERANLEAVPRELKKLGWTVRHGSKGRGGRKSSRYVVSPDKEFELRLSDHELPETMERLHNRQQFGDPQWSDELILSGRENPRNLINEIFQRYKDFISN